ncbi:MAG: dTDP-4-dehydrorhamnose reductase [Ignavibacteria bacterium]|nr:dTDP-4-dehydrorhamnose reductase [Ignavibacteria bacterium]
MINGSMIKTRILIIGSNGMLGQRLAEFFLSSPNIELLCTSQEEKSFINNVEYKSLDITQKQKVKEIILDFFPDFVINTAAYTNVDKAEYEKELAWKTNVNGIENISLYSWTIDAHLIHISTDYIFDGKNGPYSEEDKPSPINYYGRSKLASENSIRTSGVRFTIIRSNVLYGPTKYGRPDFVKWVIDSLSAGKEIKIVSDQFNNPTYIDDICHAINKIIEFKKEGIYNIAGPEILSRLDFTYRIADYFSLDKNLIIPIVTDDLKQPAPRPLKSGLITLKAETQIGYKPTSIEESFAMISKILSEK